MDIFVVNHPVDFQELRFRLLRRQRRLHRLHQRVHFRVVGAGGRAVGMLQREHQPGEPRERPVRGVQISHRAAKFPSQPLRDGCGGIDRLNFHINADRLKIPCHRLHQPRTLRRIRPRIRMHGHRKAVAVTRFLQQPAGLVRVIGIRLQLRPPPIPAAVNLPRQRHRVDDAGAAPPGEYELHDLVPVNGDAHRLADAHIVPRHILPLLMEIEPDNRLPRPGVYREPGILNFRNPLPRKVDYIHLPGFQRRNPGAFLRDGLDQHRLPQRHPFPPMIARRLQLNKVAFQMVGPAVDAGMHRIAGVFILAHGIVMAFVHRHAQIALRIGQIPMQEDLRLIHTNVKFVIAHQVNAVFRNATKQLVFVRRRGFRDGHCLIQSELHILGGKFLPVMKGNPPLQLEIPHQPIFGHFPSIGQPGIRRKLRIVRSSHQIIPDKPPIILAESDFLPRNRHFVAVPRKPQHQLTLRLRPRRRGRLSGNGGSRRRRRGGRLRRRGRRRRRRNRSLGRRCSRRFGRIGSRRTAGRQQDQPQQGNRRRKPPPPSQETMQYSHISPPKVRK